MRIAVQQTALGDVGLAECFERAGRAGAEGIGLCHHVAEDVRSLQDPQHLAEVRSLAERFGIAVTGLQLDVLNADQSLIGPAPLVAQSQELIRQAIAVATELGRCDVIVPFFGRNRIEFPKEFDTAMDALSELADTAEDQGVVLAVKTSLHLGQLQQFLAGCGSDFVKVSLDTGEVTACRHDPISMIEGLGCDSIAQVHLKDVRVITGLPPNFNLRLGRGDVRFTGIASALQRVGYDGWLTLETPPGDDAGAIAAANVEYARKLFGPPNSANDSTGRSGANVSVEEGVS